MPLRDAVTPNFRFAEYWYMQVPPKETVNRFELRKIQFHKTNQFKKSRISQPRAF